MKGHWVFASVLICLTACGGEDGIDQDPAKDNETRATLEALAEGMSLYHAKFKKYPIADPPALVEELDKGGMLSDVEISGSSDSGYEVHDAYGHAVKYDGNDKKFKLVSPGANGQFGDEDDIEVSKP